MKICLSSTQPSANNSFTKVLTCIFSVIPAPLGTIRMMSIKRKKKKRKKILGVASLCFLMFLLSKC